MTRAFDVLWFISNGDNSSGFSENDLHHWKVMEEFSQVLEQVFASSTLSSSLTDPKRKLTVSCYLGLFLFGLFNPVVDTMRGLCQASRLRRVQEEICGHSVSLGSFSEMQHVLDPELLHKVFQQLVACQSGNITADRRLAQLNLVAQDSSLWRALPRMAWAEYGAGRAGDAKGVRLHLRFHLTKDQPVDARVTPGNECERKMLRQMCVAGQTSVGDRYYGEDYGLFSEIDAAGGFFVFRIREEAVLNDPQEMALGAQERAAGILRHVWVTLGARKKTRSMRLRLVEIKAADQHLLLVTNLPVEQVPADLVGTIYRRRWSIELFFRWIKCILGCRHFFAESSAGVAIQLYLALIASLILQAYTNRRPSKRVFELIRFFIGGWSTREEFIGLLSQQLEREQASKKS